MELLILNIWQLDDNDEALESEALCFLFQRWRHIYDFLLSISEFRSHQASSYTENVYLVKRSEMAFRRMYFGIPEWTRTISIWSLIHYFFSLQQSWHTEDHWIKKKQPDTMRIDILASILFFEVVWISTHDPNFRVIHFFFLCFFLRNLLAWRIDLETAGWDSPMKNWSLGVENMICHVECSYSTKISSSSFFLI